MFSVICPESKHYGIEFVVDVENPLNKKLAVPFQSSSAS
jgi:hypothetical protein